MRAIDIRPGVLVVANGKLGTVIGCAADAKVEVLLNGSKRCVKCDVDDIECVDPNYDPDQPVVTINKLSRGLLDDRELELARFRFNIISEYLNAEISRVEAYETLGISNGLFYKLIKLYDKEAGPISLTRLSRGRQVGFRLIDSRREELIEKAINLGWKGRAASIASVWRKLNELCIKENVKTPSKRTVAARLKQVPDKERHSLKYGAEAAEQKYGARPGKFYTTHPLEWVQMDHTQVDLIIVSEKDRKPLGRPWLTILIDTHTRIILGYYLSLHHPSTVSVSCAVTHAVLPKKQFLERLCRSDISYSFYGTPQAIHMDNAKEFKTSGFQKACDKNRIKPVWRPYGKKHYGGHVERLIGTMMTSHVHFLPGTTMSNPQKRKGIDSEKESALSFKEFCRWFVGEVALYHGTKHSALEGSPAQEWNKFFIENKNGARHPALISNPHQFRLDFMPEKLRNIGNRGVSLFNQLYWSPLLSLYIGHKKVSVKYDPFSLKTVWIFLNEEYVPLTLSDSTKEDITLAELKLRNKHRANGTLDSDSLIGVVLKNEGIVKDSIKETKRKRRTNAAATEYLESQAIEAPSTKSQPIHDKPNYSRRAEPFSRGSK